MKKILIIIALVLIVLVINKEQQIIIPEEAIRFRIIANTDHEEDQKIKKEIVNNIKEELIINNDITNIEDARNNIKKSIPKIEQIINNTLKKNNIDKTFNIEYGLNYFPKKEYKGVIYEEGEYESLVVTIGEGKGKNFWCVLFPPLCMIDKDNKNIEYKSAIKEIIERYFY